MRALVRLLVLSALSALFVPIAQGASPAFSTPASSSHAIASGKGMTIGKKVNGVTALCYDAAGFSCASGGYNGTSGQIGGNGWTTQWYWVHGSAGPNGTKHNCTTYASFRLQNNGYAYPGWYGDANSWDAQAWADNPRVVVDQTPAVGAIAQWNLGTGHVAYVEEVTKSYIVTTSDSYMGGTDKVQIDLTSAKRPDNYIHFKDLYEDKLLTQPDGTAAVVVSSKRQKVADYPTWLCAAYVHGHAKLAVDAAAFANIPDANRTYTCNLDKTVLRASDQAEPKPSFAYHDRKRFKIQDGQTFQYLINTEGYRLADVPLAEITSTAKGRSLTDGGNEPLKLYAPNFTNKIVQSADLKTNVFVGSDNKRQTIGNAQLLACAQYKDKRTVAGGYSVDQIYSIPSAGKSYSCSFEDTVLHGDQPANPRPSWAFHDGKKWAIPDPWTYDYYKRKGWPIVDIPSSVVNQTLPGAGNETPKMDPASIEPNSMISGQGVDYIVDNVDGKKVKRRVPYIQDNVCWRRKVGIPIVATGLTADQLKAFPNGADDPCIIGPAVVKSDNGKSYVVDGTNTKSEIPDTESYAVYVRANSGKVYGPWPATDVNYLPGSGKLPAKLDYVKYVNNIICRDDNVCWVVNDSGIRLHIPTFGDNVCLRWAQGMRVLRSGISGTLADTLPEQGTKTCNMNGAIMATNEGHSYLMENNTRRPIVDQWDFNCLAPGRKVIRGIGDAEANGLGATGAMGMQSCAGARMVAIRSLANNKTVSAEFGYSGNDYAMLRARNNGVGGAYEQFRLIGDCNSGCNIQSAYNRSFVSAEANYQGYAWGEMRSRAGSPGGWETFKLVGNCSSGCAIWANANSRYVTNEMQFTGAGANMLRARSQTIGGWEKFVIQ